MEYIELDNGSVQRFGIRTKDGKETGEYIEIDPEDVEFPFRANECQKKHQENVEWYRKRFNEIEETFSKEGEFPTERDVERLNATKEFLKREEEAIDGFIGEGTTRKLLNGRKPYVLMFPDIMNALAQMIPALQDTSKKILQSIREKYKKNKEDNII